MTRACAFWRPRGRSSTSMAPGLVRPIWLRSGSALRMRCRGWPSSNRAPRPRAWPRTRPGMRFSGSRGRSRSSARGWRMPRPHWPGSPVGARRGLMRAACATARTGLTGSVPAMPAHPSTVPAGSPWARPSGRLSSPSWSSDSGRGVVTRGWRRWTSPPARSSSRSPTTTSAPRRPRAADWARPAPSWCDSPSAGPSRAAGCVRRPPSWATTSSC